MAATFEDWLRARLGDSTAPWVSALIESLMISLHAKDAYTAGHCRRVGQTSYQLAKAMEHGEEEASAIGLAGLLHDIGKMAIPDAILQKSGRLNPEEEAFMRTHPEKSVEILAPLFRFQMFRDIEDSVRHHHERIDGQGYPSGLQGKYIPLGARIILVCDTFDAITSGRPYRDACPPEFAIDELKKNAGTQFDKKLVQSFLEIAERLEILEPRSMPAVARRLRLVKAA